QPAAQVLDVERGEPGGEVVVGERAEPVGAEGHLVELAVEHVDLAVVEVGGVQEVRGADVADGQAGVDGPGGRLEADLRDPGQHPEGSLYGCTDPRVPAGDRPGQGREDEHGRPGLRAVGHGEVGRVAGPHDGLVDVEHLAGRPAARDHHLEGLL